MHSVKHMHSAKQCQAVSCIPRQTGITSRSHMAKKKDKDANAVALGRKGGKARRNKLTAEQRKEIASRAAKARWSGKQSGNVKPA